MSDDTNTTETMPARPPRRFRRLRIAVSVFFGVLTVALCILWVRSYFECNILSRVDGNGRLTTIGSNSGYAYFVHRDMSGWGSLVNNTHGWKLGGTKPYSNAKGGSAMWPKRWKEKGEIAIPYWCLMAVSAAASILPLPPARFSLRTLLIATTLVAVMLGLVVWLAS